MINIKDVALQVHSENSLCTYIKLLLLLSDFNEIRCR